MIKNIIDNNSEINKSHNHQHKINIDLSGKDMLTLNTEYNYCLDNTDTMELSKVSIAGWIMKDRRSGNTLNMTISLCKFSKKVNKRDKCC